MANPLQAPMNDAASLYSQLELNIFRMIIRLVKDAKGEVNKDNVIRWQAEQLAKMGQLTKHTAELLARYDDISQEHLENVIKSQGLEIIDQVDKQLTATGKTPIPISSESNEILQAIINQTWRDLNNNVNQSLLTTNYGENSVCQAYTHILNKATVQTVTGLKTFDRALFDAVRQEVDAGIKSRLVDKGGHRWSLEGYTRTVLRTTANRTYNELRMQRMEDYGQVLCLMSSHPAARPACAPIQGHVVLMVPRSEVPSEYQDYINYPSIYDHGYGTPAGTMGINCSHAFFPYTPGISTNNQPKYDPDEAMANMEVVQKQRALERSIRDAKKRLMIAEEMGDENGTMRAKNLVRARQKRLRELINDNDTILSRDYGREKVVSK